MNLFKHLFVSFLRKRHTSSLFGRRAMPLDTPGAGRSVPDQLARQLAEAAHELLPSAMQRLHTRESGLSDDEAADIALQAGPNEVEHEKPLAWYQHLWLCYKNPFNLLLTVLATVSYLTEDPKATIVIGTMVVLSTLLRFVQEGRSNRAAERLKAMVSNTATVLREQKQVEVPIRQLVPGDIIILSAGDMIPADCRLLSAKDLFVSQAAMTGESLPVEKAADLPLGAGKDPLELCNLLFMGTNVISGAASALVLATGNRTYFGTIATKVSATERAPTAFQAGVNSVSWLLIRFAMVMAPLVFILNGFTKGDWTDAFLFALSVAVGLTPEMLPMIVTSTLAKGAVILSKKKVVVKRLDAIQNFGAMNVLCTDKTGTLTQDKIVLERHTDVFGNASDEVLQFAYLNSHYQTGLKNLLDRAVLDHVELQTEMNLARDYAKIDEIPFDFVRRRMSVVVSERQDHHELICKGAVEEILDACSHMRLDGADVALNAELLEKVLATTQNLNSEGLRVVAVAVKEVPPHKTVYGVADETALTLIGYVAFLDPPKESTAPALRALAEHGVTVKVLTGDNQLVTAKICREVGLEVHGVVMGSDLDGLDDAALAKIAEDNTVFAKLSPLHKERLVRALRGNGHIVGFMGDGINDAPALRAADIGISVDTAVDIAKEAADIILLEKSLMVLEEGVLEGRRTFSNMLKYIRMTASSNFGNVFSVLVASVFLPFLPMLPLHLLVQNLLYDVSQIAIPFDNVDAELVQQPLSWNPRDIGRFMVFFGPISSIFDIATFALMWHVFGADTPEKQTLFQSGWFIVGLLTQTLIVHLIRTPKLPFIDSIASFPLLVATAAIMALGIFLPMGPLAGFVKLEALPLGYFPWLIAILAAYTVLTTLMKRFYLRKFGWQ
ncbi:magnesium-translocating P-type ATPase [Janthinobacterium agaricidamnosum]|uniref:Magnesium-transporting ATPase, P-type 1 n=1 Tax=Janthinobacterium agaricidamnosum NBRC 102515 = DSM 9628 TaxID=1349767 RepID=W0V7B3_9BURK|nr:magnesium-translocating P-type ATPase [Janthinobacterium agaricidamnosum]CDG83460.1 magnesium-translocating P-type ATPase [Janthinobacterium agaricidamnosum NBRC 102515 = DSM 9628]